MELYFNWVKLHSNQTRQLLFIGTRGSSVTQSSSPLYPLIKSGETLYADAIQCHRPITLISDDVSALTDGRGWSPIAIPATQSGAVALPEAE